MTALQLFKKYSTDVELWYIYGFFLIFSKLLTLFIKYLVSECKKRQIIKWILNTAMYA